jgi:hypothetical protein
MSYALNETKNGWRAVGSADELESGETFSETVPVLVPTIADIESSLISGVQLSMDTKAQGYGYDDIRSAISYADEPIVAKFQNEGLAFRKWRSQVWEYCYQGLNDVKAGTKPLPTLEELIAELPAFVAPSN